MNSLAWSEFSQLKWIHRGFVKWLVVSESTHNEAKFDSDHRLYQRRLALISGINEQAAQSLI
jgi:hypothetical protein